MNHNNSVRNNQAFFKDNLNLVYALGGSIPATFVPERQSEFTALRINMLKFMFNAFNYREIVCYSQKTIARRLGCSRKAVNEAFMFFREMKIIDFVSGKNKWTMNEYSLGQVLYNPYIRWALRFVFTNLTRAYFKIMERLKPAPKSTTVEPKVTQLTNVNVLEELNTSNSSYREKRLYSTPFLKKENWLNQQKQLWSDWSVREIDLHIQREERENMYKQWVKPRKEEPKQTIISKDINSISTDVMNERVVMCKKEQNIERRLAMYQKLKTQVQKASIPYIEHIIRKTLEQKSDMHEFRYN